MSVFIIAELSVRKTVTKSRLLKIKEDTNSKERIILMGCPDEFLDASYWNSPDLLEKIKLMVQDEYSKRKALVSSASVVYSSNDSAEIRQMTKKHKGMMLNWKS